MSVKLNIGGGTHIFDGYTTVDRKVGLEAYPLAWPDESVDEIRASHILEHFSRPEVPLVLRDWARVLKPGGVLRIAVPDFETLLNDYLDDPLFEAYLFGGQTDENDFHKVLFTRDKLKLQMEQAGFEDIKQWVDVLGDTASAHLSLNLMGVKGMEPSKELKVSAIMSVPRCGLNASRGIMEKAFGAHGIPIHTSTGAFWGQCMQRMMEVCVEDDIDVIVTVDYDSVPTKDMVAQLLINLCQRDDIDALAALQPRRGGDTPLLTAGKAKGVVTDGNPILVTTAHFGLTALRVESLREVEKPWFFGQPNSKGEWVADNEKMDPDIWFWHQWRKAGFNIYVDPTIRVGHLEERVAYFDDKMKVQRCTVPEWRDRFLGKEGKGCHSSPSNETTTVTSQETQLTSG